MHSLGVKWLDSHPEKWAHIQTEKSLINTILTKEEEPILSTYDENTLTQDDLKGKLPVLREQTLRGALIRSKAQLAKEEQKPTNFFL